MIIKTLTAGLMILVLCFPAAAGNQDDEEVFEAFIRYTHKNYYDDQVSGKLEPEDYIFYYGNLTMSTRLMGYSLGNLLHYTRRGDKNHRTWLMLEKKTKDLIFSRIENEGRARGWAAEFINQRKEKAWAQCMMAIQGWLDPMMAVLTGVQPKSAPNFFDTLTMAADSRARRETETRDRDSTGISPPSPKLRAEDDKYGGWRWFRQEPPERTQSVTYTVGVTPNYYSPRYNGSFNKYTSGVGFFNHQCLWKDWVGTPSEVLETDATLRADFREPPSILVPEDTIALPASVSGAGTSPGRGLGMIFEYRAEGVALHGKTQARTGTGANPPFRKDSIEPYFVVPIPSERSGIMKIHAFLWNAPCNVTWTYEARRETETRDREPDDPVLQDTEKHIGIAANLIADLYRQQRFRDILPHTTDEAKELFEKVLRDPVLLDAMKVIASSILRGSPEDITLISSTEAMVRVVFTMQGRDPDVQFWRFVLVDGVWKLAGGD